MRETRSHRAGTAGNRPRINLRAAQNGEAPGRLLASGALSAPFGLGSAGTGIKGSVLPHYNGSSKPRRWAGSPLWLQNKERQIHQIFQPFTRGKVRSALVASFLVGPARLCARTLSRLRSTEILSNRLHQHPPPSLHLYFSIYLCRVLFSVALETFCSAALGSFKLLPPMSWLFIHRHTQIIMKVTGRDHGGPKEKMESLRCSLTKGDSSDQSDVYIKT